MTLLVGGASKIETKNVLMSPVELRPEKGCSGDVQGKKNN
jgi:hypothetical protein